MGGAVGRAHSRRDRPAGGVLTLIEIRVPDEQEGTKAVVRAWLKQVGDAVAVNDPLVELETDKVTQEVPAPARGCWRRSCSIRMPRRCRERCWARIRPTTHPCVGRRPKSRRACANGGAAPFDFAQDERRR